MSSTTQNELAGVTSGMFKVTTETSSYLLDFDKKKAKRNPGSDATQLRKDNTWFDFFSVMCKVGEPMFIWADVAGDPDTYTNRRTTNVTKIECLVECGI